VTSTVAGMTPGRVIVLNGTTSAGKSTLARALQRKLAVNGEPWMVIALDDFFARAPRAWFRIADHVGAHAEEGMVFEMVDGAIERRVGPFGRAVLAGYRAAVAGMAHAGLNVIVDEVLLSSEDWDGWQEKLAGLDVRWIAVEVALETILQRELDRGDRMIGMAAAQFDVVHSFPAYELRVDTGTLTPDEAADAILGSMAPRSDGAVPGTVAPPGSRRPAG
jgi:chloramphenicol 3-O phosphotransferase